MQDDGIDSLDAFMAVEVNPEVRAKEVEEAKRRAEELKLRAQQRAVRTGALTSHLGMTYHHGMVHDLCEPAHAVAVSILQEGKLPKLDKILEDSDEEEEKPDAEIEVPEHKVKLIVGPGGEKIKFIQRKSKCRIQVRHGMHSYVPVVMHISASCCGEST